MAFYGSGWAPAEDSVTNDALALRRQAEALMAKDEALSDLIAQHRVAVSAFMARAELQAHSPPGTAGEPGLQAWTPRKALPSGGPERGC